MNPNLEVLGMVSGSDATSRMKKESPTSIFDFRALFAGQTDRSNQSKICFDAKRSEAKQNFNYNSKLPNTITP